MSDNIKEIFIDLSGSDHHSMDLHIPDDHETSDMYVEPESESDSNPDLNTEYSYNNSTYKGIGGADPNENMDNVNGNNVSVIKLDGNSNTNNANDTNDVNSNASISNSDTNDANDASISNSNSNSNSNDENQPAPEQININDQVENGSNSNVEEIDISSSDNSNSDKSVSNSNANVDQESNNNSNGNFNSNSNIEEIDLFDNSSSAIEVEDRVEIAEHERVYTDDIYRQLLLNELLSELPIEKQNKRYFQEIIMETVEKMLDLKNAAKSICSRPANYNKLKDNISNGIFNTDRIIPVILDKKVIYKTNKVQNENENGIEESIDHLLHGSQDGYHIEYQTDIFKREAELLEKFKSGEIKYNEFYQNVYNIQKPYLIKKNDGKGYKYVNNCNTRALRFYNIDNKYWEDRILLPSLQTSYEVLDTYTKQKTLVKKILIAGEDVNLAGFYINRSGTVRENLTGLPYVITSKFGKVGDIKKIAIGKNTAIVTLPDHGLEKGQKIYLKGTNCFPSIDGSYKDKVNVIDKDNFSVPKQLLKTGDKGELYANLALNVKTYHVSITNEDDPEKATIQLHDLQKKKVDPDTVLKGTEPALILFNDIRLRSELYKKLVDTLIPDDQTIIENELSWIEKEHNLTQIRKSLLDKYDVDIFDFRIEILENIKKMIKSNIEKIEKEKEPTPNKSKQIVSKISPIFSDKYLKNPLIIEMYGTYPYFDKRMDSDSTRFNWIVTRPDFGAIYFIIYSIENKTTDSKAKVEKLIGDYKKEQSTVERNIKDEKKKSSYFKEEKECQKYRKEYRSMNELLKDKTKYEIGDIAIINTVTKDKVHLLSEDDGKLFTWNKSGEWKEIGKSDLESLDQLCDLNVTELKQLSLDKLICLYKDRCGSKRMIRLEERENNLGLDLNHLDELIETIKNNDLNNRYTTLLKKYSFLSKQNKVSKKEEKESKNNKNTKENSDEPIDQKLLSNEFIEKIYRVKSAQLRAYLIYQLIQKDGILINNYIYSKKYKERMLCGHWYYLLLSENAATSTRQGELYQIMLDKFGDEGYVSIGTQSCKVCGEFLNIVDYDESEGLNELGERRVSREVLNERILDAKTVVEEEAALKNEYGEINCRDKIFKDCLIRANILPESLNSAFKICDTLNSILDKIGINLRMGDFLDIIVDVVRKDKQQVSPIKHKKHEMLRLKKRGLTLEKINQLESRGYFRDAYNRYQLNSDNNKNISLAVRLLLTLQYAVPQYIVGKIMVPCSFQGYHGENGIHFMACVLRKMGIVYESYKTEAGKLSLRPLGEQKTIDQVWYYYKQFSDLPKIIMARKKKEEFDFEKKQIVKDEPVSYEKEVNFGKDVKLEVDFIETVKKSKDVNTFYDQYLERRLYLENELMKSIFEVVHSSEVDMLNPEVNSVALGACCLSPATDDNTYDFFNKITDNKSKKLREELATINRYNKLFIERGSFSYNIETSDKTYYTFNDNSLCNYSASEQIILDKFLYFCSEGISRGEKHIFNELGRCIKCGEYREEIRKQKHTVDKYYDLLDSIKVKNSTPLKMKVDLSHIENFDSIRYDCTQNYDSLMTQFVNKLSKLLNKQNDPEFTTKYLTIIQNLGFFKNELDALQEDIDKDDEKKKIITYRTIQKQRVKNIKNYINNYFRKYISAIANEHYKTGYVKLETMNSEKQTEFLTQIYNEQNSLEFFFKNNFSDLFKKLKFDYSVSDINNINGYPNVYNYTYTEVLKETPFSYRYAANMLVYILLTQLNGFFQTDLSKVDVNNENKKIGDSIGKYRIVANFIVKMFDMINDETQMFDISKEEFDKAQSVVEYNYKRRREDKMKKLTEAEKSTIKAQLGLETIDEYTFGDYTGEGLTEIKKEAELNEEALIDSAKDSLRKKLGRDPTLNEIESFKENYTAEQAIAQEEYDDKFAIYSSKEGLNVMEIGDDYGEMPQGTESEGDGFSDFTQAELFGSN